jgi:HSP20 family molecular chaperone IbpA
MWNEACELLAQAERLHRSFFRRVSGATDRHSTWEPPVDIFETANDVSIVVALPGIGPAQVQVTLGPDSILVRGMKPIADAGITGHIHRLEIPYGAFERRIALPEGHYELSRQELALGCLYLVVRKLSQQSQ